MMTIPACWWTASGPGPRHASRDSRAASLKRLLETANELLRRCPVRECSAYRHLQVSPVAGALGAEVQGVDLARPLAPEVVGEVRQALLAHLVLFFPRQRLGPAELLAFAERFGQPTEYPQLKGLPGYPHVIAVTKLEHERVNFGGVWHSDTTYLERPPLGSLLYAVEVPPYGGDTLFANQYLAYETLSEGLKTTLDGLVGVNTSAKAEISRMREDRLREAGAELKVLVGIHPPWSARTPRRAGGRSTSTPPTPPISRAGRLRRAGLFSITCSRTRSAPSSPAASAGSLAPSPSGTTAAPGTTPSTTTTGSAGSCTG